MELIKKIRNELKSKIFLYNSYIPFNKNDYEHRRATAADRKSVVRERVYGDV